MLDYKKLNIQAQEILSSVTKTEIEEWFKFDDKRMKNVNLKYADSKTYQYELDKDILDNLTKVTNRSSGQTQFLYQLCNGRLETLLKLEEQLKNCMIGYCPSSYEDVERILNLQPKQKYFDIKYNDLKFTSFYHK